MRKYWLSLVLLLVVWTPVSTAQQTVDGDAQAWREVVDSYKRLALVKSYRINKSVRTSPSSRDRHTIEVVNPDRFRILNPRGGAEFIVVGNEVRGRLSTSGDLGAWVCLPSTYIAQLPAGQLALGRLLTLLFVVYQPPLPPLASILPEIEKQRAEVSIFRREFVDEKTKGYQYRVIISGEPSGQSRTLSERLYVSSDTGLPRSIQVLDVEKGHGVETIDFHDYDAPIEISLPARCAR